jgi:hypothetical protein
VGGGRWYNLRMRRLFAVALVLITVATPFGAQTRVVVFGGPSASRTMIWVLGGDNHMSEYDGVEFRLWVGGISMPPDARKHPEDILVTRTGVVMYSDMLPVTSLRHIWSTNNYAHDLVGGADDKRAASSGGFLITSATPAVFPSGDGGRLFWFENRFTTLDRGPEASRDGNFLSWTTDLTGNNPKPVTSFRFDPCKCETGVCSESCPEIAVWAPDSGVSDFFYATRWVPGQIGSHYLETNLYNFANGSWTAHKLDHPLDHILDASDHGNLFIESPQDYSGDDDPADAPGSVTMLNIAGKSVTIFDERARFRDADYLIGFATTRAAISPDAARVAYAIAAPDLAAEIQPRTQPKKSDAAEVARLRSEAAALPRTEIITVSDPAKVLLSLPNTELVGWLDAGRLLILQHGELQSLDVATRSVKPTGIKCDSTQYVFFIH